MEKIGLVIEVFGLRAAEAHVSISRLDSLLDMKSFPLNNLPPLAGEDGYYFPSAILDGPYPSPPDGYFFLERSRFNRYFLDLDRSFDDFLASKSGKTRSTLRRKLGKFEREADGIIDWRVYQTPHQMAEFYDLAVGLAKRTYQARLYDAALPEGKSFFAKMLEDAENGNVIGFLLFLKGQPVAYLYTPIVQGRVIYGYLGFDSKVSKLSPGTVLQLKVLDWCFGNKKLKIFDFTEGEGAHKRLFSDHSKSCVDLLLLRQRPKLRALAQIYKASKTTSKAFVELLDRVGLKSRLRKWLHRLN